MTKKTNKILKTSVVIIFIIALVFVFGRIQSSAIFNSAQIQCTGNGDGTLNCNSEGGSFQSGDPNGYVTITIDDNPNIYFSDLMISLGKTTPVIQNLLHNPRCSPSGQQNQFYYSYINVEPASTYSGIATISQIRGKSLNDCANVNAVGLGSGSSYPGAVPSDAINIKVVDKYTTTYQYNLYGVWDVDFPTLLNRFPNQLLAVNYNVKIDNKNNPTVETVSTYAICDLNARTCKLKIPETTASSSFANLVPTSMKMYLKENGFTEDSSLCVVNGIEKCIGTNLSICQNFNLIPQGQIDGKCGYTTSVVNPVQNNTQNINPIISQTYDPVVNQTTIVYSNGTVNVVPGNVVSNPIDYMFIALLIITFIILLVLVILIIRKLIHRK